MHDRLTTLVLVLLTVLSLGACVLAVVSLLRPEVAARLRRWQYSLLGLCTLGCLGVFGYRAVWVHHGWQPLTSHVDGLLLISGLLAVLVLYLQSRSRLWGLSTFALPLLSLLLAWAVCASAWTFYVFEVNSLWMTVHLAGVYLGTLFVAVAGVAGCMFLYAQHRLRHGHRLEAKAGQLASLEAIESLIVRSSTLGFGILTIGLVTGLIIQLSPHVWAHELDAWYWFKVALAVLVWLIYALVMNVHHTTHFRGARAAWLSIAGLLLLLVTFGVASRLPIAKNTEPDSESTSLSFLTENPAVRGVPRPIAGCVGGGFVTEDNRCGS